MREAPNFDTITCESRLMHGLLRIAVAELFLFRETGQSPLDYGLEESAAIRRYCLPLFNANHLAYKAGVAE
jgi:hypothetical protein